MFDPLIANSGRLRILTALAAQDDDAADFVRLRDGTGLTDGNLATHARRLSSAGLLAIHKHIRAADGKPVTTLSLTPRGRQALHEHVRQVVSALNARPSLVEPETEPGIAPVAVTPVAVAPRYAEDEDDDDDWVD